MKMLLSALIGFSIWSAPALACGPTTDCVIGDRIYRIKMPDGHDGVTPVGAVVHAHGYRGTANGTIKGMTWMASKLGVALIAPKSKHADWVIPGAPGKTHVDGSAEFEYFDAMIADASARFPIDRNRLMASGFSAGGMMVWNLACHRGGLFAAYAPVAGTFWTPVPARCPSGPVSMIHMHGKNDRTVPLNGRRIADTKQGEVLRALDLFRRTGGFQPKNRSTFEELTCERSVNAAGQISEFCLHDGAHNVKSRWLIRAWREFEKLGAL